MQIQTIPSALFSLRTCCALAWFVISQIHYEGIFFASKGRCQSNSMVRSLALTLRRTGQLQCVVTVFNRWTQESTHDRRGALSSWIFFFTIRVFNVLQILHQSVGIQQLPFLPSAGAISSSGRHFRYVVCWRMTTLIDTCPGRLSVRHIFDVFLGVLLHEHANVCQQPRWSINSADCQWLHGTFQVPFDVWYWGVFGRDLSIDVSNHTVALWWCEVNTPDQIWSNPGSSPNQAGSWYRCLNVRLHTQYHECWGCQTSFDPQPCHSLI